MMRGRLRYVERINRSNAANHLPSCLKCSGKGHTLRLEKTLALLPGAPPPDLESPLWVGIMIDEERWSQIVTTVHFFESALDDREAAKRTLAATMGKTHQRPECHDKFASERALYAHAQRMHGYRTGWSKRVDDSGVCQTHKATLHTRIRVLNHVRGSERRTVVMTLPELPGEAVEIYRKEITMMMMIMIFSFMV